MKYFRPKTAQNVMDKGWVELILEKAVGSINRDKREPQRRSSEKLHMQVSTIDISSCYKS